MKFSFILHLLSIKRHEHKIEKRIREFQFKTQAHEKDNYTFYPIAPGKHVIIRPGGLQDSRTSRGNARRETAVGNHRHRGSDKTGRNRNDQRKFRI